MVNLTLAIAQIGEPVLSNASTCSYQSR